MEKLLPMISWLLPVVVIGIVVQFIWNSVLSVVLYRMSKTDRNTETMKLQLEEANATLVNERFSTLTKMLDEHVAEVGKLKDYVRDNTADKKDFSDFVKEMRKFQMDMFQATSRIERQSISQADLVNALREAAKR